MKMMETFADWLREQLDTRGWYRSEAARRGDISASMFDKVINGYANPGLDFLIGVSRALGIPREEVFRRAGVLPPIIEDDSEIEAFMAEWRQLSVEDRIATYHLIKGLNQARRDREKSRAPNTRTISPNTEPVRP